MLVPIQSVEIAEVADKSNSVIQKRLALQGANELMETYFNDLDVIMPRWHNFEGGEKWCIPLSIIQ